MDLESEVLIGPGSIPTGAIFLDQFGWECSNLNAWIQPILSCMQRGINFL